MVSDMRTIPFSFVILFFFSDRTGVVVEAQSKLMNFQSSYSFVYCYPATELNNLKGFNTRADEKIPMLLVEDMVLKAKWTHK